MKKNYYITTIIYTVEFKATIVAKNIKAAKVKVRKDQKSLSFLGKWKKIEEIREYKISEKEIIKHKRTRYERLHRTGIVIIEEY